MPKWCVLSAVFAMLALPACTTTTYPVGSSTSQTPDLALIGSWRMHDVFVHILPAQDGAFTIVEIATSHRGRGELNIARGTSALVGGYHFLNIEPASSQAVSGTSSNISKTTPVLYRMRSGNELTYCFIDEDAAATAVKAGRVAGATYDNVMQNTVITARPDELDRFIASTDGISMFRRCSPVLHRID